MIKIFALIVLLLLPVQGYAARQFDGTDDALQTASTMTLGSPTKLALSFWLYWDSFANDFDVAFETTDNLSNDWTSNSGFLINPNYAGGINAFVFAASPGGQDIASITRPSAATWHHYVVNFDVGQTGNHVVSVYVDGSSQTVTANTTSATTGSFGNNYLNFMARNVSSLNGAGRLADVAIYTGINLSGTDASNLNGGTLPTSVQSGNLTYYWKICGTDSPETATTGSLNVTVTQTTQVAHPAAVSASCGGSTPRNRMLMGVGS